MCAVKKFLASIDRFLSAVETVYVSVALVAMVGLIFFEVAAGIAGEHYPWAAELAMYWLVGLTFVGSSIAVRGREHIRIDGALKLLGKQGHIWAERVVSGLCSLFFLGAVKIGYDFANEARLFDETSPALGIPIWLVYIALPLAGLLLALRYALLAVGWSDLARNSETNDGVVSEKHNKTT